MNIQLVVPVLAALNFAHPIVAPTTFVAATSLIAPVTQNPTLQGLELEQAAIAKAAADGEHQTAARAIETLLAGSGPFLPLMPLRRDDGDPVRTAVLTIDALMEQELDSRNGGAEPLSQAEIDRMTQALLFLARPATKIPQELLGYLEGKCLSIAWALSDNPRGRNVEDALRASERLRAKVVAQ